MSSNNISVIIPVYNNPEGIRDTIESLTLTFISVFSTHRTKNIMMHRSHLSKTLQHPSNENNHQLTTP